MQQCLREYTEIMTPESPYNEYRCKKCDKLFFKGVLVDSEVEVKCKRCGQIETIVGVSKDKFICLKFPCLNRVSSVKERVSSE